MNWLSISIIAYLLIALQSVLDKFLLSSKRVSHPAVYAFYSGLLSLSAFLLFPFGFHAVNLSGAFYMAAAGFVFTYGIYFLFSAIRDNEATQTIPAVGAITSISTCLLSFFVLGEKLEPVNLTGVFILILGGLLISLDTGKSSRRFFLGFIHSMVSGFLLALSYVYFKKFFDSDNFVNVYIWTRFGLMLGALSLFLFPSWRRAILRSLGHFKKPKKQEAHSGILFVLNKGIGGVGSFILNYAISLGSVTIVNALVSMEYLFIFIMAWLFSFWAGKIFREKKDATSLFQKFAGMVVIGVGMFFISK